MRCAFKANKRARRGADRQGQARSKRISHYLLIIVAFCSALDDRETRRARLLALPPAGQGVTPIELSRLLLLVEDDVLIRMNLEEELAEAGFDLAVATNGREAMAELEVGAARFCAVVTDIRLGRGPDGWEVVRRAREAEPDLPVLYISGDSAHEWAMRGVPKSIMIAKPFHLDDVVTALSALLAHNVPRMGRRSDVDQA